jgi:hypothetical protein
VLSYSIRQHIEIKGNNVGTEDIKVLQFADDMSGELSDKKSANAFLKTVENNLVIFWSEIK